MEGIWIQYLCNSLQKLVKIEYKQRKHMSKRKPSDQSDYDKFEEPAVKGWEE